MTQDRITFQDNGLFVELAVMFAKAGAKVNYYSPWEGPFPKSNQTILGAGIPGIARINDVSSVIKETDVFVFPDVYFGGRQLELEAQGKDVWGSRKGEELEIFRKQAKEYMKTIGLNIGPYVVLTGLDAVREHLKAHEDQWVKADLRGDMETFHSLNYKNVEPKLDELEHNLGAKKKTLQFIVEEGINEAIEFAYDGYCIDGEFPKSAMWGIEIKDKGYLGKFCRYDEMPRQIREVNSSLSKTLKRYHYRNAISPEMRVRIKDGKPFVIDPAMRFGSPPSEVQQIMYKNLPKIITEGAKGNCIEPIPSGKYAAEMLIHSSWADGNWQAVQFPEKIRDNVKFRNLTIIEGEYYVVPQHVGLPEIGAVVAVGNTLKEAIKKVSEYAEQIEGYYIDIFPDALEDAEQEVEKLARLGIKF